MRRLSGVLLACAIVVIPALSHGHGDLLAQTAPQKTLFTGDVVIQAFSINPDKTADYEQIITKLKEALSKSEAPEAKEQLAGWKVIKNAMPNPDGTIVYIHIISPVVKTADYSVMNNIYSAVKDPAEQKAVYDMYRGALKAALFVIQGPMVADLSK
jgi:predicted outer membrane lipoprotein